MKTNLKMQCPKCSATVNVDELIASQLEQSIRKSLEEEIINRENALKQEKQEFEKLSEQFSKDKLEVDEIVNTRVRQLMQSESEALKEKIRREIQEEEGIQLQELRKELDRKSSQLKELNLTKAKLESLRREKEELESKIILEKEKELSEKLEQVRFSIKEQVQQEVYLKLKEREKVIEDLRLKLDEAKRKAEQGSMQLQGEVQELEIVKILQEFYPHDEIKQTKKGTNAADVLQLVKTQENVGCGKIYYESKRTKTWSGEWIPKLKKDNLQAKADILVLVTNALPKEISRFGVIDGVWVCGFGDVKELSLALRFGLMKIQLMAMTHQGRESKMELLYRYLTSEEFKNVFETILDGFKTLQESHHTEKLKMQKLWKEREKTLEHVLSNAISFYGSIKGIAGKAVPELKMLEGPTQE